MTSSTEPMTPPLETDAGLVGRLRNCAATRSTGRFVAPLDHNTMGYYGIGNAQLDNEAATRIEALTAENKRLTQINEGLILDRHIDGNENDELLARALAAEACLATIEAETRADERERCERIARQFTSFEDNPIATTIRNKGD